MDFEPKYNQSCTYTLTGICNKAEIFNEFYELEKVPSGETYIPDQHYRLFEKPLTLTSKGQIPVQRSC